MECIYCKNTFSGKSSLKYHQKSAKYCLKLQGTKSTLYNCEYCDKSLSTKQHLLSHMLVCKKKDINNMKKKYKQEISDLINVYEDKLHDKDKQLQEQKQLIIQLQDKLENVAIKAVSRATTTNNQQITNYIQKLEVTTDQYIEDQVPLLTIEHIKKGPKGYAEYALKHPLNNRLICVDYSRRKVKYKDNDGNVIADPEMTKLSSKLFESIKSRNKELIMDFVNDLSSTVDPEVQMQIMTDMSDYIMMVNRGAEGEKTELYHDFLKDVCSQNMV